MSQTRRQDGWRCSYCYDYGSQPEEHVKPLTASIQEANQSVQPIGWTKNSLHQKIYSSALGTDARWNRANGRTIRQVSRLPRQALQASVLAWCKVKRLRVVERKLATGITDADLSSNRKEWAHRRRQATNTKAPRCLFAQRAPHALGVGIGTLVLSKIHNTVMTTNNGFD